MHVPLHNAGADWRCEAFPCRTRDHLLVKRRDQEEWDRLLAPLQDQGETGVLQKLNDERTTRTERLVRALEGADAPAHIIQKARDGGYNDFRSTQANPHWQNLTGHARTLGLWDIARRAQAGEFDAPLTVHQRSGQS